MIDNTIEQIKEHVEQINELLGIEVNDSTLNTPLRVSKMWVNELFRHRNNYHIDELNASMKVFDNVDDIHEMVIMSDIDFHSTCEHHWLPFSGVMKVGYTPSDTIIGLSKIPRAVKYFSMKPQLQERLVQEIGNYLVDLLSPINLYIEAVATHDCVMCRGIESASSTNTIFKYEAMKEDTSPLGMNPYLEFNLRGGESSGKVKEEV